MALQTIRTPRLLHACVFLALAGSRATALALFSPLNSQPSTRTKKIQLPMSSASQDALGDHSLAERDMTSPEEIQEETCLVLKGDICTRSNSLPVVCEDRLFNFFRTPSFRNLLVSGGGERPVEELNLTDSLLEDWRVRCKSLGAAIPDKGDSILSVESRGVEFPGLKVKSVATVGVKYIDNDDGSPRHEFVLLGTQEEAKGLPAVVWIYNKLTGGHQKKDGRDNLNARSLSTVSYETNNGNVIFFTKAFLQIGITFPKVLLKILPGDKETIQEKASSSVQKTLEKDMVQSMKAYESAYSTEMNF